MTRKAALLFAVAILFLGAACAPRNSYVRANLQTFSEFRLENGIRVVVKSTRQSRIRSVVLALNCGKALVPPEKAGLDKVTLQLMCMESEGYPDLKRRDILKRTSAGINASDGLDHTLYVLKTIDTYFEETFDLYADLFLRPTFQETFFKEVTTDLKNQYRLDLTDGYARVSTVVNREFFSGHPYASHLYTTETLSRIRLEDVRRFHRDRYVPSQMMFFCVGDFDIEELKERFNDTFGQMPAKAPQAEPAYREFAVSPAAALLLDPSEDMAREVSYVRGNFRAVPVGHEDYWPLVLGSEIVSDLMGNLIRTQNSMVYSVWTNVYANQMNYACISAYRTNNPVRVINLIKASIETAASGKCLSPFKGASRPEETVPIAEGLGFYKAEFTTSFYSGLQDNTAIARKMAASYLQTGDYRSYLYVMEQVNSVTPEAVQQAINRYINNEPKIWAVTAHPDTIAEVEKAHAAYAPTSRRVALE